MSVEPVEPVETKCTVCLNYKSECINLVQKNFDLIIRDYDTFKKEIYQKISDIEAKLESKLESNLESKQLIKNTIDHTYN